MANKSIQQTELERLQSIDGMESTIGKLRGTYSALYHFLINASVTESVTQSMSFELPQAELLGLAETVNDLVLQVNACWRAPKIDQLTGVIFAQN